MEIKIDLRICYWTLTHQADNFAEIWTQSFTFREQQAKLH